MMFTRESLNSFLYQQKEEKANKTYKQDDRMWSPVIPGKDDKNKYVYKIRILPIIKKSGYEPHEVEYLTHQYKSPITGSWTSEKCLKTIGEKCPFCEYSWSLHSSGNPVEAAKSKAFFRRQNFITNILVIKEPNEKRKDNEGKVFMWRYGKKIHEKLEAALFPSEGGEQVMFLDPSEGFDFNLTVQMKEDFPNFDLSDFSRTSTPIASSEEDIQEILNSVYDINTEFLSRSVYSNYENLKEVLETTVTGEHFSPASGNKPFIKKEKEVPSAADKDVPMFSSKDEKKVEKKAEPKVEKVTESKIESNNDFLAELEAELGI